MRTIIMFATVAAVAIAAPAAAVRYRFDVVDPNVTQNGVPIDDNTYSFFFDSSPTPVTFTGQTFSLTGTIFYSASVFGSYSVLSDFTFFTADAFGGLDDTLGSYTGEQLFTGDTSAPTFRLGSFELDGATVAITVDGSPAAVPEPASWAMMIAGFGLAGASLRSRRTTVRLAI